MLVLSEVLFDEIRNRHKSKTSSVHENNGLKMVLKDYKEYTRASVQLCPLYLNFILKINIIFKRVH